jgi:hypothetical protein
MQIRSSTLANFYGMSSGASGEIWLFEADGVTRVPIGEVPEPLTILLTAAGLMMLLVARALHHGSAPSRLGTRNSIVTPHQLTEAPEG